MDKIQKFLLRLGTKERNRLVRILLDIHKLHLSGYDVKTLKGHSSILRLRKGSIRILFAKSEKKGLIVDIAFRKDVYRNL